MVGRAEHSEWPGTRLFSGTASVLHFTYCEEVKDILGRAVDGLYEWMAPLPEDLCLLRGERPWLVSIAHERNGYLIVDPTHADEMLERHAGLVAPSESIGSP